ncbi:carboxylesterase/lipase family protein [Microbacterium allomyrinae]|uniref:Carboxylic ester hydrolase n=1 Tax=Microbacterium allomyrinae TaxID=2830666 RepID=A0A9X1LXX6_9MICO|nr:carboxylesterase family protein [Microbacterium allomyrinae]MCC2033811.1 carboxylesterase/lipase family protein [Microbacterium allomyrinae]
MTGPTSPPHSAGAVRGASGRSRPAGTESGISRDADAPHAAVSSGAVRGVSEDGIDRFLAIPYAAPPVGERRFRPPAPPGAWDGERDASAFGATAPQAPYPPALAGYLPTVEVAGDDFLTVNVWTPADRGAEPLAVLVFVHGGALTRGSAALTAYDGASFARHGIVFVSVQYRLGQEGFAVLDDVPQNLGVLDQEAALRWVRREVAAFGGDPARITVMGHSAGANTLTALLALPHAAELFDRAILQSGPLVAHKRDKAARMTREIAKRLGVEPTRAGFDSVAPSELVQAHALISAGASPLGGGPSVALAVGGDAVPLNPLDALLAGAGRGIPVLIGSTSEEYRLWLVPSGAVNRVTRLTLALARLAARVPARVVRAHRRRRSAASPGEILGQVVTDMLLRAPITRFADSRADAAVADASPTWVYEFRWRSPVGGLGAAHGMELGFVFDGLGTADAIALGGPDGPQALADAMHRAWVAFVVDGNPGWEAWSRRRPVQAFDADGGHIDYAPRQDELDGLPTR